jgi:predicted nucleic acid-binding protein
VSQQQVPPRAVLDSDIIFSRVLHELMGRVATRLRLFDLFWSDQLLTEAKASLIRRKGLSDEVAQRWVDYLRQSFPHGRTEVDRPDDSRAASLTVDPGDHHVCDLCVTAGVDYLFTHDRGYLRSALQERGIAVVRPEQFLLTAFEEQPQAILAVLELQAETWAGGQSIGELLDALERAGAGQFVSVVRAQLED